MVNGKKWCWMVSFGVGRLISTVSLDRLSHKDKLTVFSLCLRSSLTTQQNNPPHHAAIPACKCVEKCNRDARANVDPPCLGARWDLCIGSFVSCNSRCYVLSGLWLVAIPHCVLFPHTELTHTCCTLSSRIVECSRTDCLPVLLPHRGCNRHSLVIAPPAPRGKRSFSQPVAAVHPPQAAQLPHH